MNKKIRKIVIFPLLCAIILCMTKSGVANAGAVCMLKVPIDAQVIVRGVTLGDNSLVKIDTKTGRIHEIAAATLGVNYGYKQYMVTNLASPDEIQVFDSNMLAVLPSYAEEGLIEYLSVDADFAEQVNQRIIDTARAFHNRVGGYGGADFGNYFKQGSDAYEKIVKSDNCRKWGQFVRAGLITNISVSEIYRYTENAFTAKASVSATSGNGYDENYDVYFLFQNEGKGYYVTYFTYMP